MAQWLRLCSQGRGPGFNPWSGTQAHMLHLKILRAAVKTEEPVRRN